MINVCDIHVMKPLLAEHGFHFSKAKGQNFLIASWVPQRIAEDSGVTADVGVLEIGPGIGPLTQQLALRAGKVCAVEVDTRLEPILKQTVGEFDNLEILWGDVLKQDIPALVAEKFAGLRPMACANLPYYITSPILTALLEAECFEAVTVMVQKEVALRIAAKPGTADYSAFTVFCQYYAEPEVLFDVPAGCFMPAPKVTSAVITLRTRKQRPWQILNEDVFFRTVRASFAMRRKKLSNGLASGFPELGKTGAAEVLEACGLDANVRGETLDIPAFASIANEIVRRRGCVMKYEIILIDLDETIFDFKMAEKMALGKTIQAFGLEPTEKVISRYHEINRGLWAQLERGEVTHQQVLEDRFGNLFASFGMEVDKAACGRAYGDGLSERHYWLPGAEEALEKLQGKYRLFIASNGTASVQRRRMDSADLYRFFEDIFVSQEIGADKPNPAFFEGCFAKIPGFDRSKTMIVGDRISSDIVGGNNAGIATCWVNAAGETHDPAVRVDYEIKSLAELPELLEKL